MIEIKKQTGDKRVNFNENTEELTNISFDLMENDAIIGNGAVSKKDLHIYIHSEKMNPEAVLEKLSAIFTEGGVA